MVTIHNKKIIWVYLKPTFSSIKSVVNCETLKKCKKYCIWILECNIKVKTQFVQKIIKNVYIS